MSLKLTADDKKLMKTSYSDQGSKFVSRGGGGGGRGLFPTAPWPRIKSLESNEYLMEFGCPFHWVKKRII